MKFERRVVVTGLGVIAPSGLGSMLYWDAITKGQSSARTIEAFDSSVFPTTFASEVSDYNPTDHFSSKEAKRMDEFVQYAVIAAKEAVADSGLNIESENSDRVGAVVGSGIGGIQTIEAEALKLAKNPERPRVSAFLIPKLIINMAGGEIAMRHGITGPNLSQVTACASSTHAIGDAMKIIQRDDADVMLAGGTEAAISPLGFGGFCSVHALSTRNDEPTKASRPFDLNRDGFVMGAGAGILVLEELEHAKSRGANIYGEVSGYGMSCDAYHITEPHPEGKGAIRAMDMALKDAQMNPEELGCVNAHGTSTKFNDAAETKALKKVLGDHAYKIPVSSTKSVTGHLLGAAGAVEAVAGLLTMTERMVPPTINYETPDPDCDLDYVPNKARDLKVDSVLSNSFGFGGHNACLVLRRFD